MKKNLTLLLILYVYYVQLILYSCSKLTDNFDNNALKNQLLNLEKKLQEKENMNNGGVQDRLLQTFKQTVKEEIMKRSVSNPTSSTNAQSFLQVKTTTTRAISQSDSPTQFFNSNNYERNINNLPTEGTVVKNPWSGSYWPAMNGYISVRFGLNDKNTIGVYDAATNKITTQYNWYQSINKYSEPQDYYQNCYNSNNCVSYIYDNFSPSEKYDIFLGDYEFTLTNYLKNQARSFGDKLGNIPSWFGICHGWSPASYYYPKPLYPVVLTAADGNKITFLPDDIKAITSQFWANLNYRTDFAGAICNQAQPNATNTDSLGLYTDPSCFSINPGALVMILANQIGIRKKNMIFDPNANNQIWNQPVIGYKLMYFNVLNRNFDRSVNNVKVPAQELRTAGDPFLRYAYQKADPRTAYVVGLMLNVTYAVEIRPAHYTYPMPDETETDSYLATLELDINNNILGGEWRFNTHPDFAWKIDDNYVVQGYYDQYTPDFSGQVSNNYLLYAKRASSQGQLLKSFVDYLANQSQTKIDSNPNTNIPSNRPTNPPPSPSSSSLFSPSSSSSPTSHISSPSSSFGTSNTNTFDNLFNRIFGNFDSSSTSSSSTISSILNSIRNSFGDNNSVGSGNTRGNSYYSNGNGYSNNDNNFSNSNSNLADRVNSLISSINSDSGNWSNGYPNNYSNNNGWS